MYYSVDTPEYFVFNGCYYFRGSNLAVIYVIILLSDLVRMITEDFYKPVKLYNIIYNIINICLIYIKSKFFLICWKNTIEIIFFIEEHNLPSQVQHFSLQIFWNRLWLVQLGCQMLIPRSAIHNSQKQQQCWKTQKYNFS